jgi:hypothetical protein
MFSENYNKININLSKEIIVNSIRYKRKTMSNNIKKNIYIINYKVSISYFDIYISVVIKSDLCNTIQRDKKLCMK